MPTTSPRITVAIGQQMRLYYAFITTAPAALDAPATVTLYLGTLSDLSGLAADPIPVEPSQARTPARLVLIDAMQLVWQRARYRNVQHLLAAADPVLVSRNTLQYWLWERLQAPVPTDQEPKSIARNAGRGRRGRLKEKEPCR